MALTDKSSSQFTLHVAIVTSTIIVQGHSITVRQKLNIIGMK